MLTIENLKNFGANVDDGLRRCINNENVYLKLVNKAIENQKILDSLTQAINDHNLDEAFEMAHALKGIFLNLALTPILEPLSEMVDLLRNKTDTDYSPYLEAIKKKIEELRNLAA